MLRAGGDPNRAILFEGKSLPLEDVARRKGRGDWWAVTLRAAQRRVRCANAALLLLGLRRRRRTALNAHPFDIVLIMAHAVWETCGDSAWDAAK